MTAIVAVHGIWNHWPDHAPEDVVAHRSAEWARDLATGLGRASAELDLTFAYYAHHLHHELPTAQGIEDDPAALDRLERERPSAATAVAAWIHALDQTLQLRLPHDIPQGRLAVPLRQLVAFMAERLKLDGRLARAFVVRFITEVDLYLGHGDSPARIASREQVAEVVTRTGARVVIAHSLGSVVAYEALHAHPELEVDLFLTIGSPLAVPHGVFDRLKPEPIGGKGNRPPGVRRWVNVSDHGDIVAVPRPFGRRFPGVDLDLVESIALFDVHRAGPYLRSAAVAATVAPCLS